MRFQVHQRRQRKLRSDLPLLIHHMGSTGQLQVPARYVVRIFNRLLLESYV